ncbi:MAG: SGNH/GDSL hydrolase family protein [Akkermansiaceae bacterium]
MKLSPPKPICLLFTFTFFVQSLFQANAELIVEKGEKIAFLGDSITQAGKRKNGYITFVIEALNHENLNVTAVPAGISGHKSTNMLARVDKDVVSKAPDWMLLSCGVNDVWHFTLKLGNRTFEGVPLKDYKKNIIEIIDKAEAADIKVMILTSTMIGEDPEKETNQTLEPYNDFLRELAKEKGLLLADLNEDMRAALAKIPDEKGKAKMFGEPNYARNIKNKLTSDGCHMNTLGNAMMAKGILKTFGLSDAKIAAAEKRWLGK